MLAEPLATPMFSLLGAPYYRRHAVRSCLIVACLALTAAIQVGMSLGNASLKHVFHDTLERVAGRAEIHVSGAGGVPEDVLDQVRAVACVSDAAATILRLVPTQTPGGTAIAVLGVDLLEDDRFRDYAVEGIDEAARGFEDALILLAQPDSVLLTRNLAERHALDKGSELPVWTGRESRNLVVRGLLADTDLTSAYGGNLAVMDLYAAQHVFVGRRLFDRIDVQTGPSSSVEGCVADVDQALGGRFDVAATAKAGGSRQAFSAMYATMVDASTLLALLAALLLIHHAAAVGVAQREKEIGLLFSLGADYRRIRRFVLAEAALAGAAAGVLGLAIGYAAARPFAGALKGVLRLTLGFAVEPAGADLEPVWGAGMIAATAAVAVAGAWGAAGDAARVPPIQLAGGRRFSTRIERGRGAALGQAAVLAGAGGVVQRLWVDSTALYVCLPLVLAGLWRFGRAVEPLLFRLARPVVTAVWPLPGALAVHSLARESRRVRGPLLAIALAVAVITAVAGVTSSYAERFLGWASERIRVDYVIHSAAALSEHGALLPPETYERFLTADGIAEAARLRRITGRAAGRAAGLFAVDLDVWQRAAGLPAPRRPNSSLVSRNFASLSGLNAGDAFSIETPSGPVELRADQIVEDYTSEQGAVYFDWAIYERFFQTDAIEMIGVILAPSANRRQMREKISTLLPSGAPILIVDPSQISTHIRHMVNRWRRANSLQAFAVVPIAILAAGSFFAVSLTGKRQQLAILEALGAAPAEIRRCVWAEAAALGLAGSLLGLACGVLLQLFLLASIERTLLGFDLPFELDWRLALGLLAAGPGGAMLAAWMPAHATDREPLVRQLADE